MDLTTTVAILVLLSWQYFESPDCEFKNQRQISLTASIVVCFAKIILRVWFENVLVDLFLSLALLITCSVVLNYSVKCKSVLGPSLILSLVIFQLVLNAYLLYRKIPIRSEYRRLPRKIDAEKAAQKEQKEQKEFEEDLGRRFAALKN